MNILMISRPTLFSIPGGDTVQIQETAKYLGRKGVEVSVRLADENIEYDRFDLIHFFNIIRPNSISPHVAKSKLPYVVSTIFVDYSSVDNSGSRKWIYSILGANGMEYLKILGRFLLNGESIIDPNYLLRGHKKSVERVLQNAKALLPNSQSELNRLKASYNFTTPGVPIPNGVNKVGDEKELQQNNRTGVVCVARIEPIKNQLNLIRAVNRTNYTLKLVGKPSINHSEYFEACKNAAENNPNISFEGQKRKEEVYDYYLKSKVHAMVSRFETTGLSSLEAAAHGCAIVISKEGDQQEYFGDEASYANTEDINSIQQAIEEAMEKGCSKELYKKIVEEFTWEKAAEKTLSVYKQILVND